MSIWWTAMKCYTDIHDQQRRSTNLWPVNLFLRLHQKVYIHSFTLSSVETLPCRFFLWQQIIETRIYLFFLVRPPVLIVIIHTWSLSHTTGCSLKTCVHLWTFPGVSVATKTSYFSQEIGQWVILVIKTGILIQTVMFSQLWSSGCCAWT